MAKLHIRTILEHVCTNLVYSDIPLALCDCAQQYNANHMKQCVRLCANSEVDYGHEPHVAEIVAPNSTHGHLIYQTRQIIYPYERSSDNVAEDVYWVCWFLYTHHSVQFS